jgi:dethiobiotin synthetase
VPIILITANYLGAISHSLCAIEAIEKRQLKIAKIIVNEHLEKPIETSQFITSIKDFYDYEILSLKNFIKKLD